MDWVLFSPPATARLGAALARALGLAPGEVELRRFESGEFKIRPLQPVGSRTAIIVHSLHGETGCSTADKLCELLFLAGAIRDAGAAQVCALIPYFGFARKDRRTQPQDPVTFRYVAQMMEAVGIGRVAAIEVHNPAAFDNAFRIPARHLSAAGLFAEHFAANKPSVPLAVISPDLGGAKRAQLLREALQERLGAPVEFGCVEKRRVGDVVSGQYFAGDVADRAVILYDDLVSSGTTLLRAAHACRAAGAVEVHAAVAHMTLTDEAANVLTDPLIDSLTATDTVEIKPALVRALAGRLTVLPAAGLLAQAVADMAHHGS